MLNNYKEVLGINRRNQEYVRSYNSPSAKKIADNKIATKKLLKRNLCQIAWQNPRGF